MSKILSLLLGASMLLAQSRAETNSVSQTAGTNAPPAETPEAIDKEFHKLMEADDDAQADVDRWIRDSQEFAAKGAGTPPAALKARILERFEPVRKGYEDFLRRHPNHVQARMAYASFLGDIKDEDSARDELEKALAIDTNNPAIYNNLANIYGHIGPDVKTAFRYYEKAIELNPLEPVYYHNFGTTVYLFRSDAQEYFHMNETQVFAKAFGLYSNAMRLDPMNFPLASDVAQSYYGLKPIPTDTALAAWTNALHIAHDEVEREGVYIHFARLKLLAGRLPEAQGHLDAITNQMYAELKERLQRNLDKEKAGTNTPPKVPAPAGTGARDAG